MDRRDFIKLLSSFIAGGFMGFFTPTLLQKRRKPKRKELLSGVKRGPVRLIKACEFCGGCVTVCPTQAIEFSYPLLLIHQEKCIRCRNCEKFCPVGAIRIKG